MLEDTSRLLQEHLEEQLDMLRPPNTEARPMGRHPLLDATPLTEQHGRIRSAPTLFLRAPQHATQLLRSDLRLRHWQRLTAVTITPELLDNTPAYSTSPDALTQEDQGDSQNAGRDTSSHPSDDSSSLSPMPLITSVSLPHSSDEAVRVVGTTAHLILAAEVWDLIPDCSMIFPQVETNNLVTTVRHTHTSLDTSSRQKLHSTGSHL